jgi:hypothetical protein
MNARLSAVVAVVSCCIFSCEQQQPVGSKYIKQQNVSALQGGTVTVTDSDDKGYLKGLTLQIPPSSLSADTNITIAEADLGVSLGAQASDVAELGPDTAMFTHPITVVIPYTLQGTATESDLFIIGVDAVGNVIRVSGNDLAVDKAHKTVSFITRKLIKYGALTASSSTDKCPVGEVFCGCCNNGSCQPAGQPCPAIACSNIACAPPPDAGTGGGTGGGSGGGGSCCAAGETWCGCGNIGKCIDATQACPLACPVQGDPTTGGSAPPAQPVCCGPGTYLCGCGGNGQCIPDTQACPLACPVCDPTTVSTPCGCLPPGAVCGCDPNQPSTVPCQCDPTVASSGGTTTGGTAIICTVDAGSPCQAGEYLSPCGCIPVGALCVAPDAGSGGGCGSTATGGGTLCCDGQCAPPGGACPQICFADGGTGAVDGGVCPPGTARCSATGPCQPAGIPCQVKADGGP